MARRFEHIIGGLEPGCFYFRQEEYGKELLEQFTDAGTARDTRDELTALLSGVYVFKKLNH
jgi:hypothetical protein